MEIGKIVVAYCRVSTLEQRKNGLGMDIQVRDVQAFADAHSLPIGRFYKDEAQSGATEKRRQLTKLVRDCERGLIRAIIIPALDRLSRDVRIAENLFHRFDELAVDIFIADMPAYDSKNRRDVMIRQIREVIAEDNRKEIIERLWKGRQERVRKGKYPGGNTPYGFSRVGKQLAENPAEAQTIRLIFELSGLGYSSVEIAKELVESGHVQRNGKPWQARQVRAILTRRGLYETGIIRYGEAEGANDKMILVGRAGGVALEEIGVGAAL